MSQLMVERKVRAIGDICNIIGGGTPSKDVEEFYKGDIAWATVRDMKEDVITQTECKITAEAVKKSSTNIIKAGNVVIATRVGLGKVCIVNQDTAINQDLRGIVPKRSDALNKRYLYWWLKSIAHIIEEEGTGATVKGVKLPFVKSLQIPLPPLPEQKRIVAILDEAFAGISQAVANAEKNLANARELFESYLNGVFTRKGEGWVEKKLGEVCENLDSKRIPITKSKRVSGAIPYYGASGIVDYVSDYIFDEDLLLVSEDGANLLARTYPIAFSISGKAWVNNHAHVLRFANINSQRFIEHYLNSISLEPYVSGMAQPKLNQKLLNSILVPFPPILEQKRVVKNLDALRKEVNHLEVIYSQKLTALTELKQSILQNAFSGELTADSMTTSLKVVGVETTSPEFAANILAFAYHRHALRKRDKTFGHVKAQKILHLVESIGGIDLGRNPIKDAAGPNDFQHMLMAEEWAKANKLFAFLPAGRGYEFKKLSRYNAISNKFLAIRPYRNKLEKIIDLLIPMSTEEAEVFATVHAAWNELMFKGDEFDDSEIIYEARDNWHSDKMNIPVSKFRKAIRLIRDKELVPDGKAKRIGGQEQLF